MTTNRWNANQEMGWAVIVSKVGRRGQLTLPRAIRRWLNLHEGDRVAFVRRGDAVVLQPLTRSLLDLRGSVPASGAQDFADIRERVVHTQAHSRSQGGA